MKHVFFFAAALMSLGGSVQAADHFAPDNPTWHEYAVTCRANNDLKPDCRGSALGAFAELAKTSPDKVTCDWANFWKAADAGYSGKVAQVLPWQDVLQQLVAQDGICHKA
jgi:hypothetical protein